MRRAAREKRIKRKQRSGGWERGATRKEMSILDLNAQSIVKKIDEESTSSTININGWFLAQLSIINSLKSDSGS